MFSNGVTDTVQGVEMFDASARFDPIGRIDRTTRATRATTKIEIRNAKLPATNRRELPPAEQGVSVKRNTP
jgi:hypothetical protein